MFIFYLLKFRQHHLLFLYDFYLFLICQRNIYIERLFQLHLKLQRKTDKYKLAMLEAKVIIYITANTWSYSFCSIKSIISFSSGK